MKMWFTPGEERFQLHSCPPTAVVDALRFELSGLSVYISARRDKRSTSDAGICTPAPQRVGDVLWIELSDRALCAPRQALHQRCRHLHASRRMSSQRVGDLLRVEL